ncbi:MAG: nitroreductase family protein [Galbibacter orientalis]|uniref:nitroreductase family protein n=1 Tax=Galbibacter orientalis TaxID=453852 RepID=UPI003003474A
MNTILKKVRTFLRGLYRIYNTLKGFSYDFKRFLFYGGWKENLKDVEARNYSLMMAYHGLEKSLSYKERNPNSGWSNAERVFYRLMIANKTGNIGFHDRAGKKVLQKFLSLPVNSEKKRAKEMIEGISLMNFDTKDTNHGAINFPKINFEKGKLNDPEDFFFSRYSLREFSDEKVNDEVVQRAIKLAMKTPSVCNRHPWKIYYSSDFDVVQKALLHQNGNRPFGKKVQSLLIITTDLKAFFAGAEHYQHWIDGGLISMSVMYALHSLGVSSCPLNWSQTPKNDKKLRAELNIASNHTIIMMLAIGYPDIDNMVCSSARRPINEVLSKLELRK